MTSSEDFCSNDVEANGISFEVLMPNRELNIPKSYLQSNVYSYISVQLSLCLLNKTSKPFRFNLYSKLNPQLIDVEGQVLRAVYLRIKRLKPKLSHYPLIKPGESFIFCQNAKISWGNPVNQCTLSISKNSGGQWNFHTLKTGRYYLQFIYKNEDPVQTIHGQGEQWMDTKLLSDFWLGTVCTPLVDFLRVSRA